MTCMRWLPEVRWVIRRQIKGIVDYYVGSNIDEQAFKLKIGMMISQPIDRVLKLCSLPAFNGFPSKR